ncbi:hypothetical protein GX48_04801 [Paracoccidioides brasiliensis]|nr:hypothetical protein GX48_04801 [Paracoccidioides brasiliensis]
MVGNSSDAVWRVMDVYPQTDFPDNCEKAILNSAVGNQCNFPPRRGLTCTVFNKELPHGTMVSDLIDTLKERAFQIFRPTNSNGIGLHKTYVDDESCNSSHGHAYRFSGIGINDGAIVTARPDQCL